MATRDAVRDSRFVQRGRGGGGRRRLAKRAFGARKRAITRARARTPGAWRDRGRGGHCELDGDVVGEEYGVVGDVRVDARRRFHAFAAVRFRPRRSRAVVSDILHGYDGFLRGHDV